MMLNKFHRRQQFMEQSKDKKPILCFTTADKNNFPYAVSMLRSFRKFHDWPMLLVTDEDRPEELAKLPKDIEIKDLKEYLKNDPQFFFRQKPVIGEEYIKDYELVLGLDCDQLILGDLSYILDTKDYDVGFVLNYNELDARDYGLIGFQGVLPIEYANCGLVAMRNEKFVHDWNVLCFSPQFERAQYREQDLLNAMIYYGNWNCRCFDHMDPPAGMQALWGIFGKTFWNRCELRDDKVILPKSDIEKKFPDKDVEIKIAHLGGGAGAKKNNWSIYFSPEVMERINYLISKEK